MRESIARQFHSALTMLGRAIEQCPEPLWLAGSPNRFWHIAYHALFYTHFYLAPSETEFVPLRNFGRESRLLAPNPDEPYSAEVPFVQADLLEYAAFCHGEIDLRTAALDLEAPSGFSWLPFTKLELQFYSLRHLAHHTGQLAERLRTYANLGVVWVR